MFPFNKDTHLDKR